MKTLPCETCGRPVDQPARYPLSVRSFCGVPCREKWAEDEFEPRDDFESTDAFARIEEGRKSVLCPVDGRNFQ